MNMSSELLPDLEHAFPILSHVKAGDFQDLVLGEATPGTVLYVVISFLVFGIILPLIRISAATLITAAFKSLSFLIFGEEEMARMVAAEGYIYYGYIILKQYWEYIGLIVNNHDPMAALRRYLVDGEDFFIN